jgi:hypothetical protein
MCQACREALNRQAAPKANSAPRHTGPRPLCFQCYQAGLSRERAIKAAGELDTASDARFQCQLPFEPLNRPRLEMLKAERANARTARVQGTEYVDKRRRAQIAARHALQRIAAGLSSHRATARQGTQETLKAPEAHDARQALETRQTLKTLKTLETRERTLAPSCERVWDSAVHAAELQLPESWLQFVVSR